MKEIGHALLIATILLIAALAVSFANADEASAHRPLASAPPSVTVKHHRTNRHQRAMIARVLHECDHMRAKRKVLIAAVATATQESTFHNLRHGDRDSLGLYQIRAMHGSTSQRLDPEWSARWFCSRAINVNHHLPHLTVGQLSQAVQRSGARCRLGAGTPTQSKCYARWTREAVRTYRLTLRRP